MYVCMYVWILYICIYIHHIYHICCVCKSIISNAAYIQTYTYSWTLDPGLFSACTFKSDALRKKLRFRIMTLSHFETQPERAKKKPALKRQRKLGVMSRPLRFVFCFVWISLRDLDPWPKSACSEALGLYMCMCYINTYLCVRYICIDEGSWHRCWGLFCETEW